MKNIFKNINLSIKISLLGIASVLLTVISLLLIANWQSYQFNHLAQNEVDKLINLSLDNITNGVVNLVQTENDAIQQQVNNNLKVERQIVYNNGGLSLAKSTISILATNQLNKSTLRINIPKMLLGNNWLGYNSNPSIATPIIDEVSNLVGGYATIFQRINENGDMVRVATNILNSDGNRAIGTYIPCKNNDGSTNEVISTVLNNNTYHGRAYVVNQWYITAYEPILDNDHNVIGMLYVGIKQKNIEDRVRQAILKTKVGNTGYVFVVGSQYENRGKYIISQYGIRDGENIWDSRDSDSNYIIRDIVNKAIKLKPNETTTVRYRWLNPGDKEPRWKIARLSYYKPWDWVIGTSVYEDELNYYSLVLNDGRLKMTQIMSIAGFIIIAIIGVFGIIFSINISRPVHQMTKIVKLIIDGNMYQKVNIVSNDEIGKLAHAFNIMTQRLNQMIDGLKKSEDKYRRIIETANEGIWWLDKEHKTVFINKQIEQMLGFNFDEMVDKPIQNFFANTDYTNYNINTIDLKNGISGQFEQNFKRKDGEILCTIISTSPLFDDNNTFLGSIAMLMDITKRKAAEEELRFRNLILSTQQEVSIDGIKVVDMNKKLISYNQKIIELWKIPLIIIEEKDDDKIIEYTTNLMFNKDEYINKINFLYNNPKEISFDELYLIDGRTIERYSAPMIDNDNNYFGRIWFYRDITERKIAEITIRESEQKMKDIIGFLPDATFTIDTNGTVITWNYAIENMTGVKAENMIGKSNFEYSIPFYGYRHPILIDLIFSNITPQDLDTNSTSDYSVPNHYNYIKKEGNCFIAESTALLKNEKRNLWAKSVPLYDSKSNIIGAIESIRDITDIKLAQESIKQNEENYRNLFINAMESIFIIQNHKIILANPKTKEFIGLKLEELTKLNFLDMIFEDDKDFAYNNYKRRINGEDVINKYYLRIIDANKNIKWVLINAVLIQWLDKPADLVFMSDVNDRIVAEEKIRLLNEELEQKVIQRTAELNKALKRIEESNIELKTLNDSIVDEAHKLMKLNDRLALSEQELKNANTTKDKFFSIIAHDLKNPIGGIRNLAELLHNYSASIDVNESNKIITTLYLASNHTYNLLENLLQWARVQTGRIEFEPVFDSIEHIITNNINLLQTLADSKKIAINYNVPKDLTAYYDPNFLNTIIRNLITNALKFTEDNGNIQIDAKLFSENSNPETEYVLLSISDNGSGMTFSDLNNLFKIDRIMSKPGTKNEKGSGLGLVLCKEFIEKQGGKIWVDSQEGKGSTFYFTVPKTNH